MPGDRMASDAENHHDDDHDNDNGDVVEFSALELPSFGTNANRVSNHTGSSGIFGAYDERDSPFHATLDNIEGSDEELDVASAKIWHEEDPIAVELSDAGVRGTSETYHEDSAQIDVL